MLFRSDGTTDEGEFVTHEFVDPGLYTVSLDVVAPGGTASATKVAYIQVNGGTAPLVDFEAAWNPVSIWDTARFTPTVVGNVDTYDWDFGGISTNGEMIGLWSQPPEGVHTVSVTVTGPGGSTTKTKVDYLEVRSSFFSVDFLVHGETTGTAPFDVEFVALPEIDPCAYEWDFGDMTGTNGPSDPNPTHTYTTPGLYTVTLNVSLGGGGTGGPNGGCGGGNPIRGGIGGQENVATMTKIDLIEVLAAPGDCDEDGDIDLDDYACFNGCFMGPNAGLLPGCETADMDGDGDVDLTDFGAFQAVY